MNQTEKVARWLNEVYGTITWDDLTNNDEYAFGTMEQRGVWLFEATELLALIDQQADKEMVRVPYNPEGTGRVGLIWEDGWKIVGWPEMNQQAEPVGWVHRHQVALLNNPKTIGIEAMVYRHEPKAYDPPGAFVPIYLNPPASREREAASSATCSPTALVSQVGSLRYPGRNLQDFWHNELPDILAQVSAGLLDAFMAHALIHKAILAEGGER